MDGEDVRSDHVLTMDSILVDDHLLIRSSNGLTELFQLSTDRDLTRDLAALPATGPRRQRLEAVLDAILQSPVPRN